MGGQLPEQRYSREEMQQILDTAVQSLKPDFRTVFMLRDIEELSTEETAETSRDLHSAVKSRLLRWALGAARKIDPVNSGGRGKTFLLTCKQFLQN